MSALSEAVNQLREAVEIYEATEFEDNDPEFEALWEIRDAAQAVIGAWER